jgi:hypothetical protein
MSEIMKMTEYPNEKFVKEIWMHPLIHDSQKMNIKNYCDKVLNGNIEISYYMKNEYGRMNLVEPSTYSAVVMPCSVRSTLFGNTEYDIDIVGAHQNILLGICENVVECEHLKYYCENRDKIINEFEINNNVIYKYNKINKKNKTKKDFVKSLFTIIMYGGDVSTWEKEFELTEDDYTLPPFVSKFTEEIKMLANIVSSLPMYKQIKNQVFIIQKQKRIEEIATENAKKKDKRKKNIKDIIFDIETFNVNPCKTLSIILQDIERLIIEDAFAYLKTLGVVITSYNYDGFQVLKSSFDIDLINTLNTKIAEKWKYINFIVKPFGKPLDMTLIPKTSSVININDFNLINNLEYKKSYIEKHILHIQSPSMYVLLNTNGDVISKFNQSKLMESYGHFNACDNDRDRSFLLDHWIHDKSKRSYLKYEYNPPPLVSPEYVFNSWNKWAINHLSYKSADTSRIYNHIRFMSGLSNTDAVNEYLLNWFAWVVQFPALKTMVCLIFFGKQRSGKSCIAENLLSKIMGKEKTMIAGSVDKIFGKFSDTSGKHLVVLNEANGKETKNIHEIIKDAISRETVNVEHKGIDAYEQSDYVNYIITTNNIGCVDIPSDDSRFMPIAVNNELIGNIDYFNKLRADMDNDDVMGSFYDDLMKRDLTGWSACVNRPITDLKNDMLELSISPYQEFINWLYIELDSDFSDFGQVIRTGAELYIMFKRFWVEVGRFNQPSTLTKFGIELKRLDNVEVKKSCGIMKYTITKVDVGCLVPIS